MIKIINKSNYNNSIETITKYVESLESQIKILKSKLESYNKDKEIQKLEKENNKIRRNSLYNMTDLESKKEKEFRDEHYNICKNGSKFEYEITGTGIGNIIKIKCPKCGRLEDITDYSQW